MQIAWLSFIFAAASVTMYVAFSLMPPSSMTDALIWQYGSLAILTLPKQNCLIYGQQENSRYASSGVGFGVPH